MGNSCTKGSRTLEFDTQVFDKSWFSKCLQHDLLAAKYTNVRCVNVIDGCTTAIARRNSTEGPSRKVFIKCHINVSAVRFDSDRARLEVDLLNRLSHDAILSPHLPRLERTTWLDSNAQNSRSEAITESRSGGHGKISAAAGQASSHILMLEFERSSGNLLAQQVEEEKLRVSERQAAEMAAQLLRIIRALHGHQLCHGRIGGSSIVLTSAPPTPHRKSPPSKGMPLEPLPTTSAPLACVSSLSPPTSGLSTTEDSDVESEDCMSSWLLPGYPQAADPSDARVAKGVDCRPGSPSERLMQASHASTRTPPRRCEGGAVSVGTPVGEGRDRRCTWRQSAARHARNNGSNTVARNTLSVNETFEGLASPSTLSAVSTRMVIPMRSMRCELEQLSARSDSLASLTRSLEVPGHAGWTAGVGRPVPRRPDVRLPGGPVAEGADGGLGGDASDSIGWDAQVSDIIDQQLEMFAPASNVLGLMPSIANEPSMYKAAASAFDIGSDAGSPKRAAGGGNNSDELMNTRWSFEAEAPPPPDAAEVARVFGDAPPAKEKDAVRPPLPAVRTTSRASSSRPAPTARAPKPPQSADERRQLFDAAMAAGAEKFAGAYGKQAPPTGCSSCAQLGKVCPDCQLRGANRRLARRRDAQAQPGPADAGKRRRTKPRSGGNGGEARREAAAPVSAASDVHVLLHLHGVSDMPAGGGPRLFAVHKDISAAGAALLLAVTGEDAEVYHLQRTLEMHRPLSRDLAWTMMSADARDFVESLIGERITLDEALRHPWMQQHQRRTEKAQARRARRQSDKQAPAAYAQRVAVLEPKLKSAQRKSPLSATSSMAHPSSPLTIQPVRKPSASGPGSPRLPRRDSGASIAPSRNPSQQHLPRNASQGSLSQQPSQPPLSRNGSHGNLVAESSGTSARVRRGDSMSLIAPHRSGSGAAPTPPRVPSDASIAGPALAHRITEERVDESGKKHVVTKFVLPPRAPSNAAQQLAPASDGGGGAATTTTTATPARSPEQTVSAADLSSDLFSGVASAESSAGLLSQPLLGHGERSSMLVMPSMQIA
eukprot:jgi/Ulvmu1/10891/UM007_0068.1